MGWFSKMCRNAGLAIHNMRHPEGKSDKRIVSQQVEEKKLNENVTLRRTTIEEIEVKRSEEEENKQQ